MLIVNLFSDSDITMKESKSDQDSEEAHATQDIARNDNSALAVSHPLPPAHSRVSKSSRVDDNFNTFSEKHPQDGTSSDHKNKDKTKDQKVQIICKLFPMLSLANVEHILSSCACDISKSIDFILSKNLNDPCNTVSMLSSAMMFHPGLYSSTLNPGMCGGNTAFGRLRPLSTCSLDAFRFPWPTMYNRCPNYNNVPYNVVGMTNTTQAIRIMPDSSAEDVSGSELENTE